MYSEYSEDYGFGFIQALLPLVTTAVSAGTQIYQGSVAKDIASTQAKYGALHQSIGERSAAMVSAQGLLTQQAQQQQQGAIAGIPTVYLLIGGGVLAAILLFRRRGWKLS